MSPPTPSCTAESSQIEEPLLKNIVSTNFKDPISHTETSSLDPLVDLLGESTVKFDGENSQLDLPFIFGKSSRMKSAVKERPFSTFKFLIDCNLNIPFAINISTNSACSSVSSVAEESICNPSLRGASQVECCNSATLFNLMNCKSLENLSEHGDSDDGKIMTSGENITVRSVLDRPGTSCDTLSIGWSVDQPFSTSTIRRKSALTGSSIDQHAISLVSEINDTIIGLSVVDVATSDVSVHSSSGAESQEGKSDLVCRRNVNFLKPLSPKSSLISTKYVVKNRGLFCRPSKKKCDLLMVDESILDASVRDVSIGVKRTTSLKDSFRRLFVRKR